MTCICALVKNNHVWMAGDLCGSNGFTKKVYPDTKVFMNGDFILGYTSSFRLGQILQYNWSQPARLEGLTDREYLQLDVIESFRECFNRFGYGVKDGLEDVGGNFLIGYKGCIYEMQPNFSVLKHEDFASVGSGGDFADASLAILTEDEDFDPYYVLQKAISVAARFTTSVSEECTIVTTDEEAVKAMDERISAAMALFDEEEPPEITREQAQSMTKEELLAAIYGDSVAVDSDSKEGKLLALTNGYCDVLLADDDVIFAGEVNVNRYGGVLFRDCSFKTSDPYQGDIHFARELCDNLGIEYKKSHNVKVLVKKITTFIDKVVDILNME